MFVVHALTAAYCLTNIIMGDANKESCPSVPLRLVLMGIVGAIFAVHMVPAVITILCRHTMSRRIVFLGLLVHLLFVLYCWYLVAQHSECVKKAAHEWTAVILHTIVYTLLIPCSFNMYFGRYRAIDREKRRVRKRRKKNMFTFAES